jgi:hypothetical protein
VLPPPVPPPGPATGASVSLSASPSSVSLAAGQTVTSSIVVAPKSGPFNNAVSLSCSTLPVGLSCAFSPAAVTPGAGSVTSVLTFSASTAFASLKQPQLKPADPASPLYMLSFAVMGFALMGGIDRKRALRTLALCSLIAGVLLFSSCGGGSIASSKALATPGPFTVTVNGGSGTTQASTTVQITVK